jgi:hypothetical protein
VTALREAIENLDVDIVVNVQGRTFINEEPQETDRDFRKDSQTSRFSFFDARNQRRRRNQ